MKIAILGANSQIAKDYISLNERDPALAITAFVRSESLQASKGLFSQSVKLRTYKDSEILEKYDVVINCVGVGDPAKAGDVRFSVFDISKEFDDVALNLLSRNPIAKYIFLSSGVAYGHEFKSPATKDTVPRNTFNPDISSDLYAKSKFEIEHRHRNFTDLFIYDLRVFGYFNHTMDINLGFLLARIARAIKENRPFLTSKDSIFRDYSNALDISLMINAILQSPARNMALDLYSRSPVEKFELLDTLTGEFDFEYIIDSTDNFVSPTGAKPFYFSENYAAASLGFKPPLTALDNVVTELEKMFVRN